MIERFCQPIGLVYADQSTFHASRSSLQTEQQEWREDVLKHLTSIAASHGPFPETQLEGEFDVDAGRFVLRLYVVTSLRLSRYRIKLIQDRKYKDLLTREAEGWTDALRSIDLGTDVQIFRERLKEISLPISHDGARLEPEAASVELALQRTKRASPVLGTISGKLGNSALDLTADLNDQYEMQKFFNVQVRPRRKGRFIDLIMGEQAARTVVRVAVKDLDKLSRLMLQHRGDEGSLVRVDLELAIRRTNPKDRVGLIHQVHGLDVFQRELLGLATRDVTSSNSAELEGALTWIPNTEAQVGSLLSQYPVVQLHQLKSSDSANEKFGPGESTLKYWVSADELPDIRGTSRISSKCQPVGKMNRPGF